MTNALEELSTALPKLDHIKCALITHGRDWDEDNQKVISLKLNYSEYDNGFGGQELYGRVWLKDGTWLSRGEYDGSEWWQLNKLPEIPQELY